MTQTGAPKPPSGKAIAIGTLAALAVALIILVTIVWPAEYGRDPTGIGRLLGIEGMSAGATQTIELTDNIGGNEIIRELEIPDPGDPTPLPNPDVHQAEDGAPSSQTVTVELEVDGRTEVKAVLGTNQVMVYDWTVDEGLVYSDFHGHNAEYGSDFFVRYQEDRRGSSHESGSLVAPFEGEHGWYWVNISDHPVTVTLTVTGYFGELIDYSESF